ncbi:aldo/keto reductase [Amycolatopsis minnesotensis]|uniref:Aldo/keto reductase n=1 Tax=Amycolatopsis minnesotensis TaxID=337894 RepID=A0ABP5BVG6_9PSEU
MHSGTFAIGGDVAVNRIGYGALRLTGEGGWGGPADRDGAVRVLRRAVDLGVDLIDTADAYGPGSNEELIAEALHPYPDGVVIATKAGQCRPGPGKWVPLGRPEYLKQQAELSLRRLRLDRIDLFQLHRIDPLVPAAEQIDALKELRDEGKIRHIGLSEVTIAELEAARTRAGIATVQNRYNVVDRRHDALLEHCERAGIGFLPWHPVDQGGLARAAGGAVREVADELGATPSQVGLAWLLHRSPSTVLIPGTADPAHLEQNCAAGALTLSSDQLARLA